MYGLYGGVILSGMNMRTELHCCLIFGSSSFLPLGVSSVGCKATSDLSVLVFYWTSLDLTFPVIKTNSPSSSSFLPVRDTDLNWDRAATHVHHAQRDDDDAATTIRGMVLNWSRVPLVEPIV